MAYVTVPPPVLLGARKGFTGPPRQPPSAASHESAAVYARSGLYEMNRRCHRKEICNLIFRWISSFLSMDGTLMTHRLSRWVPSELRCHRTWTVSESDRIVMREELR
jgi:hypothetical protein